MMSASLTAAAIARDLAEIVAATFIGSLGVAALALYALRRRSADATSLTFAGFALLYAIRLAANTTIVPHVVGGSDAAWAYGRAGLTYAMVIPSIWFAEALLGAGWRDALRWLRRAGVIFAPVALAGMLAMRDPEWIMIVNNLLMLMFVGALTLTIRPARADAVVSLGVVRAGLIVAVIFVLAENLRAIGVLPWPPRLEFIGMMMFLTSLAFAVAERFLQTESRLVAVDRELATARRIQQAILPERIPAMDRSGIHVRYVPMTEVAGDFYDFLDVAGPRGTLLVADVSGHGVPAALIASMIKIAATSHGGRSHDPGALLTGLSQTLRGQLGGQFLTAMCVHLDTERGEMRWSGAGHPPVLHWQAAARRVESLPSDGILIGIVDSAYASQRVPLQSGDRVIVYTDGVLEASNATGEFFGDGRFRQVIDSLAHRSGSELADGILEDMKRWTTRGTGFDDDVTLVVIEVV